MLNKQVGVISCSGEECLGGTISRLATRKVMEDLRAGTVVSLCLPLFIAGGEEERSFAEDYPVISVDGCSKCCAKRATLKYSNEVKDSIDLSEIFGDEQMLSKIVSARYLKEEHHKMVDKVAEAICAKVDQQLVD
ncbi:MAG: putative zinc-binding protein [Peptostreptococcaceae bacterium]|nr:putative zinc-binding protein [Peptostreptococcaceae bacterium]